MPKKAKKSGAANYTYNLPQGRPRSTPPDPDKVVKLDGDAKQYKLPPPARKGVARRNDYGVVINALKQQGAFADGSMPWMDFVAIMGWGTSERDTESLKRIMGFHKSSKYKIEDGKLIIPSHIRVRQFYPKKKARRMADPHIFTTDAQDFLLAIKERVTGATGIDVTMDQAINWFRNKLKGVPDLMC